MDLKRKINDKRTVFSQVLRPYHDTPFDQLTVYVFNVFTYSRTQLTRHSPHTLSLQFTLRSIMIGSQ